MAKHKTWSVKRITDDRYPGYTVRIGEYAPAGTLHVFQWIDGKQRSRSVEKTRADLGSNPKEQERQARILGRMLIAELAAQHEGSSLPSVSSVPLTLEALANRYEEDGFSGRSDGYKRDALASIRRIAAFLGDVAVNDLTPSGAARYIEHRTKQGHKPAGRSDLVALSIAANWAIGEKMLAVNPLADRKTLKVLKEAKTKPSRPVANKARYTALKAKAPELPPVFGVLLDLAWHTGRRITAILSLKWKDVSFEKTADSPFGCITWYAGVKEDNKKHEHTRPMNSVVSAALKVWQRTTGGIGAQWVFPSETDAAKSLERHTTKKWLQRSEKLAELEHMKHGGWHAFRRGWATARKHFPLKDVAEAGGWRETQSVLECYVQSDTETTNKVMLKVV
ncbi:MAG: tyrosine-type recombinase/integrase [Gemmatimonadaceae bacterium]